MAKDKSQRLNKVERSWVMYDWANSVYATNIMAAIFPIYFAAVVGDKSDMWWGYGTSIATLVSAILAPLLGAIADYKGMKKKLLFISMMVGVVFTATMALTDNWKLMLVGYVISYIGFNVSCLFYDSFLTDVTTEDRMDKVSGWGYAMGYIGGSTIPFVGSIAILMWLGFDNPLGVKIAVLITSVWWLLFSIPILKNVKQIHYIEKGSHAVRQTLGGVWNTLKAIVKNKAVLIFILAYFFYIDGVGTVISMATIYGATLGLDSTGMILALLVTQIVAGFFSILFSKLASKGRTLKMIGTAVVIYIIICCVGFYMGFLVEQNELGKWNSSIDAMQLANILFWAMAVLVGTVQGGIQSLSRSYFGKLVPPERSNEFFGFFDIFGKFASVIGPFLYAIISDLTGRASFGIAGISLLFFVGGLLLLFGRKTLKTAQRIESVE